MAMLDEVLLGKYKVTRLLDQGGMSDIYLARQLDGRRDVVIKVLQKQLLAQPNTRDSFRREIHIMSRFQHPHAVAYYDSDANDRRGPILVMEYLRGVDLNLLIQKQGRMAPERAGRILAQLCDVLQSAHDAGIVHRDLKPGNLMILQPGTPQETVKLMDFGLAKMTSMLYIAANDVFDYSLPPTAGTPEYICPEQVRTGDMDSRGDLYSVGVILFEMLTGRRPFDGSAQDLLRAHFQQEPPSFAAMGLPVGLVTPGVEKVVRSCLAKNPDDRPKSALELATRYEQALGKRIDIRRMASPTPAAAKSSSHSGIRPVVGLKRTPDPVPPAAADDTGAFRHTVEMSMPESMALLKLKGFIFDLGGNVIESEPGRIRVRVPDPQPEGKAPGGLFSRLTALQVAEPQTASELELRMERRDPKQPGRLTVTLVMRPGSGGASPDWERRCQKIGRDLQAYIMGR
jgi:serine/threonine-protein kinase